MRTKPTNLKISDKKVETKVRKTPAKYKIVALPPDFEMSDGARKELGLSNPIKYWWWRLQMKRKWKNDRKM